VLTAISASSIRSRADDEQTTASCYPRDSSENRNLVAVSKVRTRASVLMLMR